MENLNYIFYQKFGKLSFSLSLSLLPSLFLSIYMCKHFIIEIREIFAEIINC